MATRPLRGSPPITQAWGVRDSAYRKGYHTGVDYGVAQNTAVVSPGNGTVIQVGDGRAASDGRGFFMIIQTDDGVTHHLYHLNRWHVGGGRVSEGQHVADSGNTGMSTGPHLHWETRRGGNDFNPADWLYATPAPAPAPTGGNEVFNNDQEVKEAYLMLRGNEGSADERAGWIGKSKQLFFRVAKSETDQQRQQLADIAKALANEQAKPPREVVKEVVKIVEKPIEVIKEVPVYTHDAETKNMITSIYNYFVGQFKTFQKYIKKEK